MINDYQGRPKLCSADDTAGRHKLFELIDLAVPLYQEATSDEVQREQGKAKKAVIQSVLQVFKSHGGIIKKMEKHETKDEYILKDEEPNMNKLFRDRVEEAAKREEALKRQEQLSADTTPSK